MTGVQTCALPIRRGQNAADAAAGGRGSELLTPWKSREPPSEATGLITIELSCRPGPLTRRSELTPFTCGDKMPLASQDVWLRISVADQERGLESVLWYQSMSRVCPEYPQTTPREAREGGCILKAYGEGGTLNLEPRTPGQATSMRHQSHTKAC